MILTKTLPDSQERQTALLKYVASNNNITLEGNELEHVAMCLDHILESYLSTIKREQKNYIRGRRRIMKDKKLKETKAYQLPEPGKYVVKLTGESKLNLLKDAITKLEFTDQKDRKFFMQLSPKAEYEIEIIHKVTSTYRRIQVVSLKLLGPAKIENWEKAMRLEGFIRNYIPTGWREAIHCFDFSPSISERDFLAFEEAFKEGTLLKLLTTYPLKTFQKHYIIDAVQTYFNTQYKED